MTVRRRDIATHAGLRDEFVKGVLRLKAEQPSGSKFTTYDAFVVWHYLAMGGENPDNNLAHRGPVFLPWHRYMLLMFERHMQRVLNDAEFGVPYWNWCVDGELDPTVQRRASIWNEQFVGTLATVVADGPFAFQEGNGFVVHVAASGGSLNSNLRRALHRSDTGVANALPSRADVALALAQPRYDVAPWLAATTSFRSYLELGPATANGSGGHNQVHNWIGGFDMLSMTSPNDPVFFLLHANVDRIWTAWQTRYGFDAYSPDDNAPENRKGHRLHDRLFGMGENQPPTIADVLDVRTLYDYDTLADLPIW